MRRVPDIGLTVTIVWVPRLMMMMIVIGDLTRNYEYVFDKANL